MKNAVKRLFCSILVAIMITGVLPNGLSISDLFVLDASAANITYIYPTVDGVVGSHKYHCSCSTHRGFHHGIDMSGSQYNAYLSPCDGEVISVYSGCITNGYGNHYLCNPQKNGVAYYSKYNGACNDGIGNGVAIRDSANNVFLLCHMAFSPSSILSKNNEGKIFVKKGQVVGFSGDRGYSFGAHVHMGLYAGREWYGEKDPLSIGYSRCKDVPNSESLTIDSAHYPINIRFGSGFAVCGVVRSNQKLKEVSVAIVDQNGAYITGDKKDNIESYYYDLFNLDSKTSFSKLSLGNYTFVVTASDQSGAVCVLSKPFTVSNNSTKDGFSKPDDVTAGVFINSISFPSTKYNNTSVKVSISNISQLKILEVKCFMKDSNHCNDYNSGYSPYSTAKSISHTFNASNLTPNSKHSVTISVKFNFLGKTQTVTKTSSFVTSKAPPKKVVVYSLQKIKTLLKSSFVNNQNQKANISFLTTLSSKNNGLIVKVNTTDVGIGDNVEVSWTQPDYAEYYKISINNVEQNEKVYGTTSTLILKNVGANDIRVNAYNEVGDSGWSDPATVTVHPDVNITFMSGNIRDGFNEYQHNTLTWGHSLETLPEIPSKVGNVFVGWYDKSLTISETFEEIKDDLTVYSKFNPSTYEVKFVDPLTGTYIPVGVDKEGNEIISQTIEYGNSAIAPTDYSFVKNGYHFIGWNKSFDYITDNTIVSAVTDYDNYNLPIEITDTTAVRYSYGYVINCKVTNLTNDDTQGRIVVALKTNENRMITTTESSAYYIEGKTTDSETGEVRYNSENIKVVVPIFDDELGETITADIAEVYAIANFKTTVPVSKMILVNISDQDPWTQYYTEDAFNSLPQSKKDSYSSLPEDKVETITQYRYRNLITTTTSDENYKNELLQKGDWAVYNSTSKTVCGQWSKTKPTEAANIEIEEKDVPGETKDVYHYKRYVYYNKAKNATYYTYDASYVNNVLGYKGTWETKDTDKELTYLKTVNGVIEYSGIWFKASDCGGGTYHETIVTTQAHKEYRTKEIVTTYYMNGWSNFTKWSNEPVTPSNVLDVETRYLTRYKAYELNHISDSNTQLREDDFLIGSVDELYAGREANLCIYKINEAADWTIEYISQTEIDEFGNYFFDSYKLREEPSDVTGNYTVTLGIEGATSAIYLDSIEAPKPQYKVTFWQPVNEEETEFKEVPVSIDGQVMNTQIVIEGNNAIVPVVPEIEGYHFVNWDMRSTDVRMDLDIYAHYEKNQYVVSVIDWENKVYDVNVYSYGDVLDLSSYRACDTPQMKFIEWSVKEGTIITDSLVVSAIYEPVEYEVSIYDSQYNVVDTQLVQYGETPIIPVLEDASNFSYTGEWEVRIDNQNDSIILTEADLDNEKLLITNNTYLYPCYVYNNSTSVPVANVISGSYESAQCIYLSTETNGAIIYYTLDGSDPSSSNTAIEYKESSGIKITENCKLRAIASKYNMNNSTELNEFYVINDGNKNEKLVTLIYNSEVLDTLIIGYGNKLNINEFPQIEGYLFKNADKNYIPSCIGDLTESRESNYWNFDTDTITEDTTLYLEYTPNTYTVKFLDYDGIVLGKEEVTYLSSALEPEAPVRDGYVFTGWDTDDFECVTNDMEVNAVYVDENEYVTVSLNKEKFTTMTGSSFNLNATVFGNAENSELTWYSDDADVVTVDQEGNVYAVGAGTANVTVVVSETNESSTCFVTVMANPDEEFSLTKYSHITISDSGFARGFTVKTDGDYHSAETVSEVKEQFANTDLVFTDINGNVLSDEEFVGTGTTIELIKDGEVKDKVTVIVSGDVDGDGYITNMDASRIARYLVGKDSYTDIQIAAMDVNGSDTVSNVDVSLVLRYLVGKETI